MSNTPHIAVRSLTSISTEQACDSRAKAWIYVFECVQRREGQKGGGDFRVRKTEERGKPQEVRKQAEGAAMT